MCQADLDDVPSARCRRPRVQGVPTSARLQILGWIVRAKRPGTRAQRIAVTVQKAVRGERAQ